MDIIKKHQRKKTLQEFSTFYENAKPDEPKRRIGIRFFPDVTRKLKPIYAKHDLEVVHRNEGALKQMLGSIKDTPLDLHKSGIYSIQCLECGRIYYGMSSRKIYVRCNEHLNSSRWKRKTAVGKHIHRTKHNVDISGLKLIQEVRTKWKMEFYEAIHIYKNKHRNLLNLDNGNVKSPLLELFAIERKYDRDIIDLTQDTPNVSLDDESYYECE